MFTIIDITGPQGNAFAVMGIVQEELKAMKMDEDEMRVIMADMKSGNYEHLLDVAEKYVTIIGRDQ